VPHESPWVVKLPLVLLAIPSIFIGLLTVGPMLFGTDMSGHHEQLPFFLGAIDVSAANDVMATLKAKLWHGWWKFGLHGFVAPAFWLAFGGFALATLMYIIKPSLPAKVAAFPPFRLAARILNNKYGMDDLWIGGFAGGGVLAGKVARKHDEVVIDGVIVNGSARIVDLFAGLLRKTQSGYLYHYAFAMILGLIGLLGALLWALR
jgi:NADH-quinone oxidoreductase subunit L